MTIQKLWLIIKDCNLRYNAGQNLHYFRGHLLLVINDAYVLIIQHMRVKSWGGFRFNDTQFAKFFLGESFFSITCGIVFEC